MTRPGMPAQEVDPTLRLFEAARDLPYPAGMVPVTKRIHGLSFFPGGRGLYHVDSEPPPFPFGGVMVVGQDFDTQEGFDQSWAAKGESPTGATWRQLLSLLRSAGIAPEQCFFTNAYMGLRVNAKSNTGVSPGRRCAVFRRACASLLVAQIEAVRPRLVICLGNQVLSFFSQIATLPPSWRNPRWRQIDAANEALQTDVSLSGSSFVVPALAAVIHPSFRHANAYLRSFGQITGEAAEAEVIRTAALKAGVLDSVSRP